MTHPELGSGGLNQPLNGGGTGEVLFFIPNLKPQFREQKSQARHTFVYKKGRQMSVISIVSVNYLEY